MSEINIDRAKLAKYIKENADAIANGALIDLHTVKVETMGGATMFVNTVDVEIRELPLEALEA